MRKTKEEKASLEAQFFWSNLLTPKEYSLKCKDQETNKRPIEKECSFSTEKISLKDLSSISGVSKAILDHLNELHSKFGDEFYQFAKPCKNPYYRQGESWSELFGNKYREHLQDVCQIHEVTKKFRGSPDPFEGKAFACCPFKVNGVNLTLYRKNPNWNRSLK
jgi:hypothetical protein